MNGAAGSIALLGSKPPREATVAQKLRKAGAVLLAKTNLSEWANIRSSNHCAGWSPRGGFSKGVYYPDMNPQGSSSGSAVSSAIGLSFASLGTEVSSSPILAKVQWSTVD
jgi:amidase